ncbi:MAG: hypothetical protein R3C14_47050 [Caldilineaceae bacterium]
MVGKQTSRTIMLQKTAASQSILRFRHPTSDNHLDVLRIAFFCFIGYGLFLYYFLPDLAPHAHRRLVMELSHAWQPILYSFELQLRHSFVPFALDRFSEWYQLLTAMLPF